MMFENRGSAQYPSRTIVFSREERIVYCKSWLQTIGKAELQEIKEAPKLIYNMTLSIYLSIHLAS